ncbi:Cytochrome bo(3) ubiquinol oxidase subunit 3 [Candidatus Profftia lariciata]|uniref:cytochrome o ubiquinol oxidase subunit III n=1 Tax=Candidatus Profftia lariciata TaxID=1987921 RepID=UPI001D0348D8|nr:cytochrome o ubiquinol oxidase subunit III [Candidatus Profftia lariciata]UDG81734.1 Cytochrome bo(3) ubiquinol oxidase subunit 3 [Candidatus Profftia lariciata]
MIIDTPQHQNNYIQQENNETKIFGFRLYLMSDCILFAGLCATYAVLCNGTANGPSGKDIFELPWVLVETLLLLLSSLTCGFTMLAIKKNNIYSLISWLTFTFLLGISFIIMESYEFFHLFAEGFGPKRSAFLSSFFVLVGTHGLHVVSGLLWILVMILQISIKGLTSSNYTRLICLNLFWHLLDIIWICVFTLVYLIGYL